ncbi:hypothetical protein BPT24_061 [Tenacibaculum phage pT24]|uniref:Uncharacterized protein n=1 Tax=Tenacibaculum phage pT24 TaxID=1880590 RepID=A0A1B4XWL9_9CAUD|nr:hypothetical protein HYP10_gp061 [Tenacibaculum phage pT24]BAV39184.1 hypothetical protein BPT24_061 [Tenacibaculum phage pT24]
MDIGSNGNYPSNVLSNFSANAFKLDGYDCFMEGFLQSLKFSGIEIQKEVCTYFGKKAKFKGKKKKWYRTQTLYWQGKPMKRDSKEYQVLLNRAYNAMYEQSEKFRKALHSTSGKLTHSMGRRNINETVLTEQEFCHRLMTLRRDGKLYPCEMPKNKSLKTQYDVLFDFDSTLNVSLVEEFAKELQKSGFKIGICTTRSKNPVQVRNVEFTGNNDLFVVSKRLGIPTKDIYFTEHEDKAHFLLKNKVNVKCLLDDCEHEIVLFPKYNPKVIAIHYSTKNDWKKEILTVLQNEK